MNIRSLYEQDFPNAVWTKSGDSFRTSVCPLCGKGKDRLRLLPSGRLYCNACGGSLDIVGYLARVRGLPWQEAFSFAGVNHWEKTGRGEGLHKSLESGRNLRGQKFPFPAGRSNPVFEQALKYGLSLETVRRLKDCSFICEHGLHLQGTRKGIALICRRPIAAAAIWQCSNYEVETWAVREPLPTVQNNLSFEISVDEEGFLGVPKWERPNWYNKNVWPFVENFPIA